MWKVPNLNGVWQFMGYEPPECGGIIKECHINRSYFKYLPKLSDEKRDVYQMGITVSSQCENQDSTETWAYVSPHKFIPNNMPEDPGYLSQFFQSYKYEVIDEGKTFRLNLSDNFYYGQCWERYELEVDPTKRFELLQQPGEIKPREFDKNWHLKHELSYLKYQKILEKQKKENLNQQNNK